MNLMFLGCLIKRDKIAEELWAGLAGVGSHALLPQRCSFRLSRRASCFCLPHPQARDDGLPCLPHLRSQNLGVGGLWVEL